jgi:hypothetical protein
MRTHHHTLGIEAASFWLQLDWLPQIFGTAPDRPVDAYASRIDRQAAAIVAARAAA